MSPWALVIYIMPVSSPNPMFNHLLESSHRDDSNMLSNIGFGEEMTQVVSVEVYFTHLIWGSIKILFLNVKRHTLLIKRSVEKCHAYLKVA